MAVGDQSGGCGGVGGGETDDKGQGRVEGGRGERVRGIDSYNNSNVVFLPPTT